MSDGFYNIKDMLVKMNEVGKEFEQDFLDYFNTLHNIKKNHSDKLASIIKLSKFKDISKVMKGEGMYIIFTNYKFVENTCNFTIGNLKAIYRGHSHGVGLRVISHLFNMKYQTIKGKTNYISCIQLDDQIGININLKPYNSYQWYILQLKMKKSNVFIREKAEEAFDRVFGKPLGSKK
ncbi:hypothetical protein D3C75_318980 [compost metagenome]